MAEREVQPVDQEALQNARGAYQKGHSFEQMLEYYSKWASEYEQSMSDGCYRGPEYATEAMAALVPKEKRATYTLLDIGAGTGLAGQQAKQHGFVHVHALEPCYEMVARAMKEGIYEKHHIYKIGGDPLPIMDDSYDGIISSGSFGENHIPCRALLDMIRIVRPGGVIAIALRRSYLEEATELIDRFEPYLDKLEAAGAWQLGKREIKPQYFADYEGAIYTYIVKISGTVDVECDVNSNVF